MRVILIGCEYAGKTTLAAEITRWWSEHAGSPMGWHDHFERPFREGSGPAVEAEAEQVMAMVPVLLEKYARYMIQYHFTDAFYRDNHHMLVNWYYSDAVYAPLYYGYGGVDAYADRQGMARRHDADVNAIAPDTVLVLLKATPEIIRQRQRDNPHDRCILQDEDVEFVLQRFEEEYKRSGLRRFFELDTTEAGVEETLREFWVGMEPHLTDTDRQALLLHGQLARALAPVDQQGD